MIYPHNTELKQKDMVAKQAGLRHHPRTSFVLLIKRTSSVGVVASCICHPLEEFMMDWENDLWWEEITFLSRKMK